jgi:hypothetical protein
LAAQRHKRHVSLAAPVNFTARGDTFVVGKQDDFEQDLWIICGTTCFIIIIGGIEYRHISDILDQVVQRVFKSPGCI